MVRVGLKLLIPLALGLTVLVWRLTGSASFPSPPGPMDGPPPSATPAIADLSIADLVENTSAVPVYDKFELTFNVHDTVAKNLQVPYDADPPPGLAGRIGISVEALFLPPGETEWERAIRQPAFLYQDYQRQQIGGKEWLYLNGEPVWKVRFAPKAQGVWHYLVRAQDASICPAGSSPCARWVQTGEGRFTASPPIAGERGFVEVSKTDRRYFAFSDGTPFIGLGHNAGFDRTRLTFDAEEQFARYAASGVDFLRIWMSMSTIAGSSWSPWVWFGRRNNYGGYMPHPGLAPAPAGSGHDFVLSLDQQAGRLCLFNGFTHQGRIAVKPQTTYRLAITARASQVVGPLDPQNPRYGFTAKIGGWPGTCPDGLLRSPGLVPYLQNSDWTTVEGAITTAASQRFLDYLFLTLENTSSGKVDIGEVSLKERLPDGSLGPEVLVKSTGDVHLDYNLMRSWDWDYVIDLAAQKGIYLKLVALEKNDLVWRHINWDGTIADQPKEDNSYARDGTKVRRLHEYYWRYLAARWGYSTAIHSWELLNEGNPANANHFDQAEKSARFVHQWDRNHLVTTSFWASYPAREFWKGPGYSGLDYADIHANTARPLTLDPHDAAGMLLAYGEHIARFGVAKPTVIGETGLVCPPDSHCPDVDRDQHGVFLHNLIWARLDSKGLYNLYWWIDNIVQKDLYFQYKHFRDFMEGIPIDNGRYLDARALASEDHVRVVGQIDAASGAAHLWIQNQRHTWWNVVNGATWGRLSGTVDVPGFASNRGYPVEWWAFDDAGTLTIRRESATADARGALTLDLSSLPDEVTDVAVRIGQGDN